MKAHLIILALLLSSFSFAQMRKGRGDVFLCVPEMDENINYRPIYILLHRSYGALSLGRRFSNKFKAIFMHSSITKLEQNKTKNLSKNP